MLDEAHTIKSPRSQISLAAAALAADSRWCLTGTPIQVILLWIFSLVAFWIGRFKILFIVWWGQNHATQICKYPASYQNKDELKHQLPERKTSFLKWTGKNYCATYISILPISLLSLRTLDSLYYIFFNSLGEVWSNCYLILLEPVSNKWLRKMALVKLFTLTPDSSWSNQLNQFLKVTPDGVGLASL